MTRVKDTSELEAIVTNLVHAYFGLKGADLVLKIMSKDLKASNNEVLDAIFDMIQAGDLLEVEYILPGQHTSKSFLLPKGTVINIINKTRIR